VRMGCRGIGLWVVMIVMAVVAAEVDRCPRPDEIAPCQCRTRGPSIQVRCVNSMMGRIMEAMMNIRTRVDMVDVLILENNNIPHLPSRAFGSVKVNRLFIENNRIQTIDRNAFAGVENYLTEIYIKEPSLNVLPSDSINYLRELSVFSIDSSQVREMPTVNGLQKLKLLKIDRSNITGIPPNTLKNLPGLRYLHVTNSRLQRLEVGVLENLPYLVLANFTGNQISWLHPRAFRYMEQMQELVLANNDIRDADMVGQAVKVIKTIERLDVSNNKIEKLRDGSFLDIISLQEMSLANNRLTLMQRAAFHRLPRLKKIDLSNNRIRNFHSDVFSDTPVVEELLLRNNQISKVTDVSFMIDSLPLLHLLDLSQNLIEEIPYGAMRGYPRLEKLFLSDNQISDLSEDAFADLPSLTDLNLNSNKLTSSSIDGAVFSLPNLKSLDISDNKLNKINKQLLRSLSALKRLNLAENMLTTIEPGTLQTVKHLDYLNISYNNLREVSPAMFEGLTKLFELDLSHNELVTLTDHTFIDQKDLEFVDLSFNQIQLVSSHLFAKTNRMRFLDFSSNFITTFPGAMMRRLNFLTRLIFKKNSIQKLQRDSFEGLTNLELVDLHDNRIQDVDNRAFKDLSSLKSLDLSLNVISTVGSSLEPLTNLMKLNLSDNYITALPFTAFRSLTRLSTLDISNNTIVDIGEAFVDMPEIKFLDLSYNHLPSIQTGNFKKMPKLLSLHLDHNSIIKIESESFQELWDLEKIYLTKNGLSSIQTDSFKDLPSLERLFLDDNLIKELEEKSFQNLLSLKELHLQYNLIKSINERAFYELPSIRHLNLSYNLLQDLSRYGFYGLETLEMIDVSFNDIRVVDNRVFDNLKWLVHLKLNDNNICEISGNAFKDATSLRRLDLNNNRIYKLQESAFTNIQRSVDRFDVSGNPLNCDCETKWLRNWVSSQERQLTGDEPRCYFPKALSGNPLRQLRSSRFTCTAHDNSGSLISDACHSLPLKTPAQLHMTAVTDAGIPENLATFNIQFGGDTTTTEQVHDTNTNPTTAQLETEAETNKVVELVNNVIDSELELTSSTEGAVDSATDSDYVYEYVYYYYDEDGVNGTVVDTQPASSSVKQVLGQNVTAVDIHTNTGDTPTIYAGAADDADMEKVDAEEEEKGMSIFGIPIPSIPISLSFGLVPALTQAFSNGGLIPLGRKGEASQEKHAIGEVPPEEYDQTRGPDTQIPVWVDRLKDIDFKKVASLFPEAQSSLEHILHSKSQSAEKESSYENEYTYVEPNNPIIPLSGEQEDPRSSGYFPYSGGYFPGAGGDTASPILSYHHPIHPALPPDSPIVPPTNPRKRHTGRKPQRQTEGFEPLFIPAGRDANMKEAVSLRPEQDYQYTGNTLLEVTTHRKPAFPGIDATMRNDYRPTAKTPPSLDFEETAPASPNYQYEYPYEEQQPPYAADIPEYLDDYGYIPEDLFAARSTVKPIIDKNTERRDFIEANINDQDYTNFNEVVTEAEVPKITTSFYDPRRGSQAKKDKEFVENLMKQGNSVDEIEIFEVTTKNPVKLQSTEVNLEIDIAHKGTPQDIITENNIEDAVFTTQKPEYEYEYEYEYVYEDENGNPIYEDEVATTRTETSSQGSLQSILSFLNKESSTLSNKKQSLEDSLRTKALGNLSPLTLSHNRQPTPLPPIRSSTFLYDQQGNYPEVQRSTVTVEIEDRFGRSRSSLSPEQGPTARSAASPTYPFHPDRMDPASSPHAQGDSGDNSVNWYYSSYNNENTDPYVGPGRGAGRSGARGSGGGTFLLAALTCWILA